MEPKLEFKSINLERDSQVCLRFREDAFICSFGNADKFLERDGLGPQRYQERLKKLLAANPLYAVHVWHKSSIIGQIEGSRLEKEPNVGYLNLYYLAPEFRGKGYSSELEKFVVHFYRELGCSLLRLSVSPKNHRAVKFYEKHGWIEKGIRTDHPEVHFMEKVI